MDTTKYPFIFCADLNSVPSSYVYQTLKSDLTDAFLSKGYGLGKTYEGLSPTLRIDVVLMSKSLKPTQYSSPQLPYSDHFPIITDIEIKQ
jgi:endonuclease/exonuclease/phosphatase family metal-dependent hydrolase